jgi:hypothetical protein
VATMTTLATFARPAGKSASRPPLGPWAYRVNLRPAERDPALAAGLDLARRTARRLNLWGAVKAGTATDADRRRIVERLSLDARYEVRGLSDRLLAGEIGRDAWHRRMRDLLPERLYGGMAAALGGQAADLDDGDRQWAEAEVRRQFGYLKRFATDLGTGDQPFDGRVRIRADQYGAAVWAAAQNVMLQRAIRDGDDEGRRVLGVADHCRNHGELMGCVEQAALGWQPIRDIKPIGDSPCHSRCHCRLETRKGKGGSKTGDDDAGQSGSSAPPTRRSLGRRLLDVPRKVARSLGDRARRFIGR